MRNNNNNNNSSNNNSNNSNINNNNNNDNNKNNNNNNNINNNNNSNININNNNNNSNNSNNNNNNNNNINNNNNNNNSSNNNSNNSNSNNNNNNSNNSNNNNNNNNINNNNININNNNNNNNPTKHKPYKTNKTTHTQTRKPYKTQTLQNTQPYNSIQDSTRRFAFFLVQLHKDSPLGDAVLECYASGSRNIFVLGFVPVKSENTVVLLARDTNANHPTIKDLNLDLSQWQPIVEERGLVSWLVKVPSEAELARARQLPMDHINKLEEMWKSKPGATLDDLEAPSQETEVTPVALHYEDVHQYQAVFKPLVSLEAAYDKQMKDNQSRDNIMVRWDVALNRKKLAYFFFPKDDNDLRLMPGDELKLRHRNVSNRGAWEGHGNVIRFDQSEEVCLELKDSAVPEDCTVGYSVDFVWKAVSFDRMRTALHTFREYSASISGYLFHSILGHVVEPTILRLPPPKKGYNVQGLPELNHSQLAAVKSALQQPLSLIQGPPGTGKTVTSASLVYHMATSGTGQVLVAAPSNVAVDQLAEKVSRAGLKVVRLCAKSREDVSSPCEHLTLHYQVQNLKLPGSDYFQKLALLKREKGGLSAEDEKKFRELRRRLETEILEHADVVCCTCVGAGDPRLQNFRFQQVLIDESTQATEPEVLIPMMLGAKQVVLVGDHCQLPPVIMCKKAAEAGLCQSLFERLRLLGVKPIRLQVQYRMHPCLSEFPSNTFYEGTLQNGTGISDRQLHGVEFPWPNPDKPMMFYTQLGMEEISASATSFLNRTEASNVERIITRFLQAGVTPSQIGVITPYEGQRAHVVSVLLRQGTLRQDLYKEIEVSSVDAFQGREKDIIIMSCVRSNEQQSIGFLSDPRRLNVALTRARFGIVILGNPKVLSRQHLWNSLLSHYKEAGCLVEGPLTNLKQSMVQLSRPRRVFDRSNFGVGALATNRFQPTEKVGDPRPEAHHGRDPPYYGGAQQQGNNGPAVAQQGGYPHERSGGGGRQAGGGGASGGSGGSGAAGGGAPGAGAAFMPFALPAYAIPAPPAGGGARGGVGGYGSSQGGVGMGMGMGGSQGVGLATQAGGGLTQASQGGPAGGHGRSQGMGGPGGGMNGGVSQAGMGLGMGMSQELGGMGLGMGAGSQGMGLGMGLGMGSQALGMGFTDGGDGFSQSAGDYLSLMGGLGAGSAGAAHDSLLSQADGGGGGGGGYGDAMQMGGGGAAAFVDPATGELMFGDAPR
ncbi:hypothetical protein FOA52_015969 [Chlamydomonas sp. UWO 241]|nr:hypothetical protein FOA52_015969 [Chlamydomonas sp. UWO 241]